MVTIQTLSAMSESIQTYNNLWLWSSLFGVAVLVVITTIFVIVERNRGSITINILTGASIGLFFGLIATALFGVIYMLYAEHVVVSAAEDYIEEHVHVERVSASGVQIVDGEYYVTTDLVFLDGDMNGLTVEMYYDENREILRPLENSTIEQLPLTEDSALAPLIEGEV